MTTAVHSLAPDIYAELIEELAQTESIDRQRVRAYRTVACTSLIVGLCLGAWYVCRCLAALQPYPLSVAGMYHAVVITPFFGLTVFSVQHSLRIDKRNQARSGLLSRARSAAWQPVDMEFVS